jgi:hypothetical protein
MNSAIREGRAAYVLGRTLNDNPYRRALISDRGDLPESRREGLRLLECDWDSGHAVARRYDKTG